MSLVLRPYQDECKADIYASWAAGHKNVVAVLPTGAGKTAVASRIIHENVGASCSIAHRQELVGQISMALARDGVRHRIIGPPAVVRICVQSQLAELGVSYYDPNAPHSVAGVDTLVNRLDTLGSYLETVTLAFTDEGHHCLKDNKWGRAMEAFPNARGLLVTATPLRADGKGLARVYDGIADVLVVGPGMRDLIDMGYLTDYRIFAPRTDIDLSGVTVSRVTGDYTKPKLTNAVKESKIVGDVVTHYQRIAPGKLGVTFATDVETAGRIAQQFNAAGIPAEVVHAKTPPAQRADALRRFKSRELLQLVNVDLFGEGFDLPAIEVVGMARPTQSYGLYVQQFGRALRLLDGKTEAIIIDHVGNVERHGLPDARREWSLARRDARKKAVDNDIIPVKACPSCTAVYERIYNACPYCGFKPVPETRNGPEFVDGDLLELSPETLAALRGDIERVDLDKELYRAELAAKGCPVTGQLAHVKRHAANQEAQTTLRDSIALWAGLQRHLKRPDSESYRRFYFKFNIDVMSAQGLKAVDSLALNERIKRELEHVKAM